MSPEKKESNKFHNSVDILEVIMDSWLEESDSFIFSSRAKSLAARGIPKTKAITQTVLAWLEDKTSNLRIGLSIRQYIEQELSINPGNYSVGFLYGFLNSFQTVDNAHEKFRDELGVSAVGKIVEVVRDSTTPQFPQTASLPIEDLAIPWTDRTTNILRTNPILLGAVMAANLYGRIYGNSFATPAQIDSSERDRQERIFRQISEKR